MRYHDQTKITVMGTLACGQTCSGLSMSAECLRVCINVYGLVLVLAQALARQHANKH